MWNFPDNFNPGYLPRAKDPRDITYSSTFRGVLTVDWNKSFDLRDSVQALKIVEDQGSSGSCVGQAWSKYKEVIEELETGSYTNLSARDIYAWIYEAEGGAYGYKGGSTLRARGISTELSIPSYKSQNPPDEDFMRVMVNDPVVRNEALVRKIDSYAVVSPYIDEVAHAIEHNHGMVIGFVGSNEGWSNAFIRPPKDGERVWGHFVYLIGYKLIGGKKHIIFINSWSKGWADAGFGYISEDYFSSGFAFSGFTIKDLSNNWQDQINMKDLITLSTDEGSDQFIVESGLRYRIPDYDTKIFLRDKIKIILDVPRIVSPEEFRKLQDGGTIPSTVLMQKGAELKLVLDDIFEQNRA